MCIATDHDAYAVCHERRTRVHTLIVSTVLVITFLREPNKAADTHAIWLMDNGDSGPGAQWMAPDLHDKMQKITSYCVVFRWSQKGEWAWCGCLDSVITG